MKGGKTSETYLHQVSFLRCCRSQKFLAIASREWSSVPFLGNRTVEPRHCIRKNWRCQKIDVDGSSQLKLHSFAQFSGKGSSTKTQGMSKVPMAWSG